ncbi:hypothetical protein YS76_000657 [Salmonella enterica subsp. enterica serovar Oranienburg]|nr:hypothetical protein [Salmonella enterica subsp. enterica serovar Oranienburg]EAY4421037.1 hypothetical protein [Salmonella enterica]EBZ5052344.1 hypothetical protein [Salmonella enterica subsp. enterica serovar Poona]ECI0430526.1 hypothetical protein [Salmonella enterica subsp. enterica serovar Soumbedioune]EEJ2341032.1 hypothetical protein [Salmonella enterica subsp. enterica serovar Oslo]MKV94920.1 hypothetical protein [Salmonella enterica subsp. enterica serovar Fresno]
MPMNKSTDIFCGRLILPKEMTKPIPGWPHYFASSFGDIYSDFKHRGTEWRRLTPYVDIRGYLCVNLHKDGKPRTIKVHVLVATAFYGKRPEWSECIRHLDGNSKNNNFANLAYGTNAENVKDKFIHGTVVHGEACHNSKLTERKVVQIRRRYKRGGVTVRCLAREYGVSSSLISLVVSGKVWRRSLLNKTFLISAPESSATRKN